MTTANVGHNNMVLLCVLKPVALYQANKQHFSRIIGFQANDLDHDLWPLSGVPSQWVPSSNVPIQFSFLSYSILLLCIKLHESRIIGFQANDLDHDLWPLSHTQSLSTLKYGSHTNFGSDWSTQTEVLQWKLKIVCQQTWNRGILPPSARFFSCMPSAFRLSFWNWRELKLYLWLKFEGTTPANNIWPPWGHWPHSWGTGAPEPSVAFLLEGSVNVIPGKWDNLQVCEYLLGASLRASLG